MTKNRLSRETKSLVKVAQSAHVKALKALKQDLARAKKQAKTKVQPGAGGRKRASVAGVKAKAVAAAAAPGTNPERSVVDPQVVEKIGLKALENDAPLAKVADLVNGNEALNLETDLNLKALDRERLSVDYTGISHAKHKGSRCGPIESRNATTVKKAIDLVHLRANEKKS